MENPGTTTIRLPATLLRAVDARAAAAQVTRSDILRAAAAREVLSGADPRMSRAFVEQYLAGAEVVGDEP